MTCHAPNATFYEEITYGVLELGLVTGRAKRSPAYKTPKKRTKIMEQSITVNCQTPGVECFWVECEALAFKPFYRALLEFRLRLVTETARELFFGYQLKLKLIQQRYCLQEHSSRTRTGKY